MGRDLLIKSDCQWLLVGRQLHGMFQCFKSILVFKNVVIIFCIAPSRTPLNTLKQHICSYITLQVITFHWKTTMAYRVYFARILPFHSSKWEEIAPGFKQLTA